MAGRFAVHAATLRGTEAVPVTVEVDLAGGIPGMTIVGMPDAAVLEARHRIKCALKAAGYDFPRCHVTVNLAPSGVRKSGCGFDVPIAVGILAASDQIPLAGIDAHLFAGELMLDARVSEVRGALAYAMLCRVLRLGLVGAPSLAGAVGGLGLTGVDALGLEHLGQLRAGLARLGELAPPPAPHHVSDAEERGLDYADVADQEAAKRAFVVAAAGGHGLLMVGPPGAGKTMLARRLSTILPTLDEAERLEALLVHSVCGLDLEAISAGVRPFRSPHHTVTSAGLVGGGQPVRPGEASLAHRGVLFLDELPEFSPSVLQALRQPMEDGEVHLTRADGSYRFPCRFQLVAAANPCPCGHFGDRGHPCTCSPGEVDRYQGRIGGALLDRIDVFVSVVRPEAGRVIEGAPGMGSAEMAEAVRAAREFASWRRARTGAPERPSVRELGLTDEAASTLELMAERLSLGGRAIARTGRVARTIADLAGSEAIDSAAVAEACSYRNRLQGGGGDGR